MKTQRLTISMIVLGALALTGCGGTTAAANKVEKQTFAAGTTMERLATAGTIRIGTKFDQPGYGLKGLSGKPEGFDVEIGKIIAGKLGIPEDKIQWVETPSKVREESIIQNKVDIITATYVITDERRKRVSFGGPYYLAGSDLMVKASDSAISGPESFKDAKLKVCGGIGSIDGDKIKPYLADPTNQMVEFDVLSKCEDALRTGQVDAMTAGNSILDGMAASSKGTYKVIGKPFFVQPYGVGMAKGDIKFCEFVNKSLKEAAADGSYERAWKETAGKGLETVAKLPEPAPCS
ncbi:glutamate ABC transporter substrate-binding protein [Arthrobacter sp. SDTb3-6]|uniref:glutamate ABC transporter substrate-binding protein n=1 Tax=Arthrobacter sp. SDTb3-6 TaxID=2713571 RepID=UPI00159D70A7|nr:glutamate ABC transporter substrate-binding protein [Arthrobacter sp. SDTb3-6]NVN00035.1 glutamate ABC transporter substrate-binding protein [Arthrobacter sp. SDTb3-6]